MTTITLHLESKTTVGCFVKLLGSDERHSCKAKWKLDAQRS